jgi:hypothetical protein
MALISEIAAVSGTAFFRGLYMGLVADLPVINTFDAREITDDRYLSLAMVAIPAGQFINLGEGYVSGKTETAVGEYNASRIGGLVKSQESTERKWNQRNASSIGAGLAMDYFSIQARGRLLGQLRHVQKQIFYGITNDAKGFPGLKALTPFVSGNTLTVTDTPQDSAWEKSVLNVAGTTSSTASSIYSVAFGEMDCQVVIGGPGGMANFLNYPAPERVYLEATDAIDSVSKGDWYNIASAEGYIGVSVMGGNEANASRKFPQYSVRRAANVTADSGKTCTDTVLERLEDAHPDGHRPSRIYMSHRSLVQLQTSRTTAVTHFIGGNAGMNAKDSSFAPIAPMPTHTNRGTPITATDAILNTDAIES